MIPYFVSGVLPYDKVSAALRLAAAGSLRVDTLFESHQTPAMPYRLGDDIDDYCVKCKRVTNHAVVSLMGDEGSGVAKVRCQSCYSDHDFRHEIAPPTKRELKKLADAAAEKAAQEAGGADV